MRLLLRSHWILHGGIINIFYLYLSITIWLLVSLQLPSNDLLIELKLSIEGLYFPDSFEVSWCLTMTAKFFKKLVSFEDSIRCQNPEAQIIWGARHTVLVSQNMDTIKAS